MDKHPKTAARTLHFDSAKLNTSTSVNKHKLSFPKIRHRPPIPGQETDDCDSCSSATDGSYFTAYSTDNLKTPTKATPHKGHQELMTGRGTATEEGALVPTRASLGGLTPRKHNKGDQTGTKEEAPLGFEPEGSDTGSNNTSYQEALAATLSQANGACSPPVANGDVSANGTAPPHNPASGTQASSGAGTGASTPGYHAWADSLDSLLDDPVGVELFRTFLEGKGCVHLHDFYLAWKCIHTTDTTIDREKLIPIIYRKFIRCKSGSNGSAEGEQPQTCKVSTFFNLPADCINSIKTTIREWEQGTKNGGENVPPAPYTIFDSIIPRVKERFQTFQQAFLKSELYAQFVNGLGSPNRLVGNGDEEVDGDDVSNIRPSLLESVPEDKELDLAGVEKKNHRQYEFGEMFNGDDRSSNDRAPRIEQFNSFKYSTSSYLPVSTADSEVGSMSSDALTDDTITDTNSSVDGGFPVFDNSRRAYRQRNLKKKAMRNKETHLTGIPPRPNIPENPRLAEKDPTKFAEEICRRLQKYLDEQKEEEAKKEEKMNLSLIMSSIRVEDHADHPPQKILDTHCWRVWNEKSEQQTPAAHSPQRAKSPMRQLGRPGGLGSNTATLLPPPFNGVAGVPINGPTPGLGSQAGVKITKKRNPSGNVAAQSNQLSNADLKVSDWIVEHMKHEEDINEGGSMSIQSAGRNNARKKDGGGSSKHRAGSNSCRDKGKPGSTSDRGKRPISDSQRSTSSQGRKSTLQRPRPGYEVDTGSYDGHYSVTGGDKPAAVTGSTGAGAGGEKLGVVIYLLGEPIPYSMEHPGREITLSQFKQLISHKKNSFRYFFKKSSDGFPTGVYEEVKADEDDKLLPKWEGRVIGKVNEA